MIKILFFLPSLAGGGAERTIINIANGLKKDTFDVYLVVINCPKSGSYRDEYSGFINSDVHIVNLSVELKKSNYIRILLKLRTVICSLSPDIVMSTMLKANILISAALLCSGFRGKCIFRESNNRTKEIKNLFAKLLIKKIYNNADMIVALSHGVGDDLQRFLSVKRDKIRIIYNPVDLNDIKKNITGVRISGIDEKVHMIAVGRLHPQKDYPTMIKALSYLKDKYNFDMLILGRGPCEKSIRKIIQDTGLDNHISMIGFQSNPYQYLAQADIFVLSSVGEGFGHVIIEAMACGAAVVATDCEYGPGEIITDGENGLLVPTGDEIQLAKAIETLIRDKSFRIRLSRNGKRRSLDFSCDKIVSQYADLFKSLLDH